jgi:hypothetical protein
MKIGLIFLIVCFLSVLVIAHDLATAARKERARRDAITTNRHGKSTPTYTNRELALYHRELSETSPLPTRRKPRRIPPRDMAKEEAYWRKEFLKHQKDLARLDARIRRLEWRLADRRGRVRPGERLRDEPAIRALEETLEAMHKERRELINHFQERGRKAGALPGWLR